MKKSILVFILIIIPILGFSQENENSSGEKKDEKPVVAIKTDIFSIRHLSFNKKVDRIGRGELMQVEFQLYNNTDFKRKLYVFVIGTYEELEWHMNSFGTKRLFPEENLIKYIAASPDKLDNFKYQEGDKEVYYKYPKDYKLGINPLSDQIYELDHTLIIRTELLNKYRKNYKFFNHVTIIIYDDEGKMLFRQIYTIDMIRK